MITDSIIGTVGETHLADLRAEQDLNILIKLEGDNPSGSVFDRLLPSIAFSGHDITVTQRDQLAAAIALACSSLSLPLTLRTRTPTSNSARMAAAFGAQVLDSDQSEPLCSGVEFDIEKSLAVLLDECQTAVPGRRLLVVLPPLAPFLGPEARPSGLLPDALELFDGEICIPAVTGSEQARRRLAGKGLLMDDLSAACAEQAAVIADHYPDRTVIAVAACDGAISPTLVADLPRAASAGPAGTAEQR